MTNNDVCLNDGLSRSSADRNEPTLVATMSDQRRSVIVSAARTPIGRFGRAFRRVPAVALGAAAIRSALRRGAEHSIRGDPAPLAAAVDDVIMGHVTG